MALSPSDTRSSNRLLARLSRADMDLLRPHLKTVPLKLRQDLEKPNTRIDHVYFMDDGIASVVAQQEENGQIEVGLIGPEGMTGLVVVMGNHRSPNATFIQVAGNGQRLRASELRKAMTASPSLRGFFLKFVQTFMIQAAQTAMSNGRGKLDQRLARWLLMAQDRLGQKSIALTHEFLSVMLGVRRAGVTVALTSLEAERLIRARRGEIVVLDRKGLLRRAGSFYGVPETEYRRLIG
jgi:CRP-like cAMP-binding protein